MTRNLVIWVTLLVATSAHAQQPSNSAHERASLPPAPPPAAELLERPARAQPSQRFHPRVVLKDAQNAPVSNSGQPIDTRTTCGTCHDVAWIAAHGIHFKTATPSVLVPSQRGSTGLAPNCFFCHVRHADASFAASTLAAGAGVWVPTATLVDVGLVRRTVAPEAPNRFSYVTDVFAPDGSVSADQLQLGPPANTACGACHGLVTERPPELGDWLRHPRETELTGQVFSPTRISDSAMNVRDREHMRRTWDVHAERLLQCSDCHFAPNDPRARALSQKPSENLRFEPRHASFAGFLQRPDHDFSHGASGARCENCHDAQRLHAFLPHKERHLAQVSCEACHIPRAVGPALQELDFALPLAPGQPNRRYRGFNGDVHDPGAYVDGFEPALVQHRSGAGKQRVVPVNFITTWTWREHSSQGSIVPQALVERALFVGGVFRPELVALLDRDANHRLEPGELVLDSRERVEQVAHLLEAAGAASPHLVGEVSAHALHHGVVSGRFALRDCATCHGGATRLGRQTELSTSVAPGASLVLAGDTGETTIALSGPNQGLRRASVSVSHRSMYVLGTSRERAVDIAGAGFALFTLLGALGHTALRLRSRLRRKRDRA